MNNEESKNEKTKSDIVPENKIYAYVVPGVKKDVTKFIRPCKPIRQWMDDTPARYAYRCIPLTAANTMGWEILNPVDAEITWLGPDKQDQMDIKLSQKDPFAPHPHFGAGTATWYIPFLFKTPPEYGLLIDGPANHDKDGAVPLNAFVRSDWVPFPFTMNWRLTEPNKTVTFKAGEPICRIIPYPLALLNEMEIELHDLDEDPIFMNKVQQWNANRQANYASQKEAQDKWLREDKKPELKDLWNSQYAKGRGSEEAEIPHYNTFSCKDVVDKRK